MANRLMGGCFCGAVSFSVEDRFTAFYLCHCRQCRQLTGSAFAANIFTEPGNIEWLGGQEQVVAYEHPTREFSKSFCRVCGSGLPFINRSQTALIVPAGSLAQMPALKPQANIFASEQACWLEPGLAATHFSHFPASG